MSFKKALFGSIIGGLAAGPIGAIVGGYEGYCFGQEEGNKDNNTSSDLEYISYIFSLLAKAAKADGKINRNEVEAAYGILETICDKEDEYTSIKIKQAAKNAFNSASKNEMQSKYYMDNIKNILCHEDLYYVFVMVVTICAIDGDINVDEIFFIEKVSHSFGIDRESYRSVMKSFEKNKNNKENSSHKRNEDDNTIDDDDDKYNIDLNSAYKILGCKLGCPFSEVKSSYRKMISEFHPDKIQGKGLPQDFIDFANEKTKMINKAYDFIRNNINP